MLTNNKSLMVKKKILVWVIVPCRKTEMGLTESLIPDSTRQELTAVFTELSIDWKWQDITLENMHTLIEEVAASSKDYTPIALNYCIGDEDPQYPGNEVYYLLEEKGIPSTGADSTFNDLCTSKIRMKKVFIEAGIPTAPYETISDSSIQGVCERLSVPLIIKPIMSFGSRGLSIQSVVHTDEQVASQIQQLLQGQHGLQFSIDSVFVEQFIDGAEFTVLLIGSANQPENIKVYPVLERIFHANLPETERFLSHDRYWGKNEGNISFSPEEPFCRHHLVASDLQEKLCNLSRRAYCAVGGNGCGRVDIRMDKVSQEFFVLEVNPNPLISSQPFAKFSDPIETPVGTILHLAGIPFSQLMSEMLAGAIARQSNNLPALAQ